MLRRIVLVFGLWFSISVPSMATDLQVDSDSLGPVVLGKKIKIMMRDGSYLEGKVLKAGRKEIVVHVKKSENIGTTVVVQKNKEALLRTSDIGMVYFRKSGSIAGPVAFGVMGGLLGAAAGVGYLHQHDESNSSWVGAILILGPVGGATGGALLGREVVKKTVVIHVTPCTH